MDERAYLLVLVCVQANHNAQGFAIKKHDLQNHNAIHLLRGISDVDGCRIHLQLAKNVW